MSDPYLNCPHCGEQCACRATRDELNTLKEANKRLETALEHVFRSANLEAHRSFSMVGCPLCEAKQQISAGSPNHER
jgi:hypothetical protein